MITNVPPRFKSSEQGIILREARVAEHSSRRSFRSRSSSTMDLKFKNRIWCTIVKDLWTIHDRHQEISKRLEEIAEEQRECLRTLFDQLLLPSSSVPIVTKTPKVARKRGFQRIPETIPENDVLEQKATAEDPPQAVNEKENNESNAAGGRTKRIASMKASDNIKQSFLAYSPRLNRNDDTLIKKVSINFLLFCITSVVGDYSYLIHCINCRQRERVN